uniref:Uncharacterized protein n=1 Tax=Anguilla anguilla TaxID=7936 RepID=A0A0E9WDR1_ANGAN
MAGHTPDYVGEFVYGVDSWLPYALSHISPGIQD